ncbi:hypothetical protein BpHYR1_002348 [Brachionus plicatilis]|uniref:Uncharacterized protein n=1 Tax=Brachionus plicatilis TaxID=10195 RepID=A0A3M7Q1B0_BRAPC|nr:hypothetical protein BpHYR1_002348 [Brachionus plicatilis]
MDRKPICKEKTSNCVRALIDSLRVGKFYVSAFREKNKLVLDKNYFSFSFESIVNKEKEKIERKDLIILSEKRISHQALWKILIPKCLNIVKVKKKSIHMKNFLDLTIYNSFCEMHDQTTNFLSIKSLN